MRIRGIAGERRWDHRKKDSSSSIEVFPIKKEPLEKDIKLLSRNNPVFGLNSVYYIDKIFDRFLPSNGVQMRLCVLNRFRDMPWMADRILEGLEKTLLIKMTK